MSSAARVLALSLGVSAIPCVGMGQAAKFDLACTGIEKTMGSGAEKADSRRYTFDLTAQRWCRTAECSEASAIERVTTDEITLRNTAPGETLEHRHRISRVTGEYFETIFMPFTGTGSRATGTCKPAPFSGFPKPKF